MESKASGLGKRKS